MSTRNLVLTGLGILVTVLLIGSAQSTGALWSDENSGPQSDLRTGAIGLAPGTPNGNLFTFPALAGPTTGLDQTVQAPLTITNIGTTSIRFRLATAGPTPVSPGASAQVRLEGAIGSCPALSSPLTGTPAFTTQTSQSARTVFTSSWQPLARAGSAVWCIRATLEDAAGPEPISYSIVFTFDAEQTRP